MTILEVKKLNAGYGKLHVLFDVNFYAREKEITVIVGPNGAGKTTLLNSISGVATIHSGKIRFNGKDITGLPPHKIAREGISYLMQMGNIASSLTVKENLIIAGYLLPKNEVLDRIDEILDIFPRLREFLGRKAGTLSGGERRMLAIGMALMRRPKILLLDEMTTDLAPILVNMVMEKVVELRDKFGHSIVLVEQNARRALEIGDRAYLLVSGTIRFRGGADDLLTHPEFSKLYLGIQR